MRIAPPARDTAEQEQLIIKADITVCRQDVRKAQYIRIYADIAFTVEMRLGSSPLHYDLCSTVELCKRKYASRVVIMPVAEDNGINICQVDAKRCGISDNCICLSGIKQQLMLFGFYIDTQPMLGSTFLVFGSIFNECYYLHQCSPQE